MFMSLFSFGIGIGMMFDSFHMCGMMLLFSAMLHNGEVSEYKRSDMFKVPDVDFGTLYGVWSCCL